jgi:hypothetical protein
MARESANVLLIVHSNVRFQFKISSSAHGAFKIERLFALAIVIVDFARSPAVFARLLPQRVRPQRKFFQPRQLQFKTPDWKQDK